MRAYIFPGQGAQYTGMGQNLYKKSALARELFSKADDILGFNISQTMFKGTAEELKQTKVTQPAVFLHSVIMAKVLASNFTPKMVAGHSLGELSALVASCALSFEDGLQLVLKRAIAMQKACELQASTMAAVLGLEDKKVEDICRSVNGIVVAANYNCPGQLVISGEEKTVHKTCEILKEEGAKRAVLLPVGGAFHSPLMAPAKTELAKTITQTKFKQPVCPVYQNAVAKAVSNPQEIKTNLIAQLTAPVRWTQCIQAMIADGATEFIEIGPGKVLWGLMRKIDRNAKASSAVI
ncbi:MAG: ACP S-malonyltransferase [Tenacibaculum sp.]